MDDDEDEPVQEETEVKTAEPKAKNGGRGTKRASNDDSLPSVPTADTKATKMAAKQLRSSNPAVARAPKRVKTESQEATPAEEPSLAIDAIFLADLGMDHAVLDMLAKMKVKTLGQLPPVSDIMGWLLRTATLKGLSSVSLIQPGKGKWTAKDDKPYLNISFAVAFIAEARAAWFLQSHRLNVSQKLFSPCITARLLSQARVVCRQPTTSCSPAIIHTRTHTSVRCTTARISPRRFRTILSDNKVALRNATSPSPPSHRQCLYAKPLFHLSFSSIA